MLANSYALVAPSFVLTFAGGILLIELLHHLLVDHQANGPGMSVLHVQFDDVSVAPWAVALGSVLIGLAGLYTLWPGITRAWARAMGPEGKVAEE